MIYNVLMIVISVIVPLFILIEPLKKNQAGKIGDVINKNKYELILYVILVIGFLVRTIGIQVQPNRIKC